MFNKQSYIYTICAAMLLLCVSYVQAQIPSNYYSNANNKKGEALRTALNGCISSHTQLNYDALESYYVPTDFRPDSTLWDIYSTCEFTMDKANKAQSDFCDGWNKEHTVPSSWFGKSYPMYSDIFHVLPTDARVNNLRGNDAYGETNSRTDKISVGAAALGHYGSSSFSGYTTIGNVYEPDDRYKGDIARIYFYMATCYLNKDFTSQSGSKMFTYSDGKAGLTDYSVALLMKWHRNDPVSVKEINRNDSVYKQQGNRNPFVDYPELAEYIWGNKKNENFNLATIISAYSKDYIPLDTEGGSNDKDYAKYGVNWFVNGQKIQTDSVFKNHKLSILPASPVSCSEYSNTFVGWSKSAIAGKAQTKPADLFMSVEESPAIGSNTTLHAVFAHMEQGQGQGDVTAKASFTENDGYKRGDAVTSATAGKVTIAFAGGTNPTKYYTEIRCYAQSSITLSGADINKVEFVPGSNDKGNMLKPNSGKMDDTGLVWTGSSSNLVFTVDGDSGYRGLSAIKVTYDDNTTVFIYSDYLTNCDNMTEIENVVNEQPAAYRAKKVLRNGQIVIEREGHVYNMMGQEIN